ncbi:hypothetical protein BPOR_0515g00050 [Botrytis porri]|uniref:UBC core domain-containing protein n=1 Tax=Botrytis porri TaxID=87229 RepID=A0A4Z1KJB8_9HELO|nr:hypothetical protein BPOR_0515g00050 [Botrytis porri]
MTTMGIASKRLGKELTKIHQSLPPGITLVSAEDFKEWLVDICVLDSNPLYQGETYRIKLVFTPNYPIGTSLSLSPLQSFIPSPPIPSTPPPRTPS